MGISVLTARAIALLKKAHDKGTMTLAAARAWLDAEVPETAS